MVRSDLPCNSKEGEKEITDTYKYKCKQTSPPNFPIFTHIYSHFSLLSLILFDVHCD